MKRLARAMTALAAVLAMAACTPQFTSELSPNPKTSAQLRALALNAKNAPPGIKVLTAGPVDDRQDYADLGAGAKPECADLDAVATKFIFGGTRDQPVGATAVSVMQSPVGVSPWIANERLASYAPGEAHLVIQDLTDMATACAGAETAGLGRMPYTTITGPTLGDESMKLSHVTVTGTYQEADTVVIRSGDNLIIVEELLRPQSQRTPLDVVAAAAYRAFVTG